MGKSKAKTSSSLPLTPILCINDPQLDIPNIHAITRLIPAVQLSNLSEPADVSAVTKFYRGPDCRKRVMIICQNHPDDEHDTKISLSHKFKAESIKQGCNFVSINLYLHSGTPADKLKEWGTNHLDLNIALLTPEQTADKVYKWLFTILSIPETLHLISPTEMRATDTKHFPHYEYCPLSESRLRPKDAKIQFVALITSKPVVTPGSGKGKNGEGVKLTWTVADRSGSATFYFLHRGPSSQPTWDWVLSLKPGDRKALPRMPCVAITESFSLRLAKAPFRLVGAGMTGTGNAISSVGHGMAQFGTKMRMGRAKEWVYEADVGYDEQGKPVRKSELEKSSAKNSGIKKTTAKTSGGWKASAGAGNWPEGQKRWREMIGDGTKREVKVFDEKGRPIWGDEDSDADTERGSLVNEKL